MMAVNLLKDVSINKRSKKDKLQRTICIYGRVGNELILQDTFSQRNGNVKEVHFLKASSASFEEKIY